MRRSQQIINVLGRASYNPVTALGSDLIAYWDANRSDLITVDGSNLVSSWKDIVGGYDAAQATASLQPVYSPTGYNGAPGITPDGIDDFLETASLPAAFPTGANGVEVYAVAQNDVPGATTASLFLTGYGGGTATSSRLLGRIGSAGTNFSRISIGNGVGSSSQNGTTDSAGRHVLSMLVGGTQTEQYLDNVLQAAALSVTPSTGSTRLRVFTSNASTTSVWAGPACVLMFTKPLTTAKRTQLNAWLQSRRRP